MQSTLIQIQRWLVLNKNKIIWVCYSLEISAVFLYGMAVYAYANLPDSMLFWYELGTYFGQVAVFLYMLTLIPGILSRLQFQPLISAMMMPFRRHFGIMMFLAAHLHAGMTTTILSIITGEIPVLMQGHLMGVIALWTLLPLWLTSNDFSQKKLGKGWKMLHRLTYIALVFIFLHVAMMQTKWMYPLGVVLVLEVASWVKVWLKPAPAPVAQPPKTPPTP